MVTINPESGRPLETSNTPLTRGRGIQGFAENIAKPDDSREVPAPRTRLAWGAVIAGALFTLALLVLFSSFATAVGIPAYRGGDYGWGAGIWSVFSAGVAFFVGGIVVEYLTRRGESRLGFLHGVLAWVLAVNLMAILSMPAFGALRGMFPLSMAHTGDMDRDLLGNSLTAAGWGVFVSLLVGMFAAAIGGVLGYFVFERRSGR